MKIHAIQTGTVQIHQRQVIGQGSGLMRTLNMILDNEWTPPLPIYAWAIEHPEGVIVVDTGDNARTAEPNYFPRWHPYYRRAVKFDVKPDQEIGPQLKNLGITADDVRTVILTHMHTDHAGGLHHFPKSEIWIHPAEYAFGFTFAGRITGSITQHYPAWLKPKSIAFTPERVGAFASSQRVTRAGDVIIVPTHGHTPAHISVIAVEGDTHYFLAGDTSYIEKNLREKLVDAISPNLAQSAATMQTILDHARQHSTIYLPTHDPESAQRLENKTALAKDNSTLVRSIIHSRTFVSLD